MIMMIAANLVRMIARTIRVKDKTTTMKVENKTILLLMIIIQIFNIVSTNPEPQILLKP